MSRIPTGYRPLAWAGLITNALSLLISLWTIIVITINPQSAAPHDVSEISAVITVLISYSTSFVCLPLSAIGGFISYQLLEMNPDALRLLGWFLIGNIYYDISLFVMGIRFYLPAPIISFYVLEAFVSLSLIFYWGRPAISDYVNMRYMRQAKRISG